MRLPEEDRVPYSSSQDSLGTATTRVEQLTAELDRINANPNASTKEITSAINRLNVATEIQIKEIQATLNRPSVIQESTKNEPFTTSGFDTGLIIDPTPFTPSPTPTTITPAVTPVQVISNPPVKTAPIDTVLIDQDTISIDTMTDLIWEDIGGHELINIARNDTINGQTVLYQPIKNITSIQQQYNPNNIVSLQNTSDKYFINFPIKLETKLPEEGEGGGLNGEYVYIETSTGDLIIELINLEVDEQVEVQISLSGTIYEAEFNES